MRASRIEGVGGGVGMSSGAKSKTPSTGKIKAAKKQLRTIDANGKLGTRKGSGMVSNAPLVKGKNSKANVTDWKSVEKALVGRKTRYITKAEKKDTTARKAENKLDTQNKKYPSKPWDVKKVPVKKKGK